MGKYKYLILKTAAVVSCVVALGITGCQGGNGEAAAVKNKSNIEVGIHNAKGESVDVQGDGKEDIEAVVRSNGLTGQDTEDLRDDNKRETASDGREPEVTVEAEPPKDEGRDAGEKDRGTDSSSTSSGAGEGSADGSSAVSSISDMESTDSAGWDGGMENDSAVSEYSESGYTEQYDYDSTDEWYESDSTGVEAEEGFTDEYSDSGMDEQGQSDSGEMTYLGVWASTGYCPGSCCCGVWASGYTASGTLATEGRTVACGSLPMGTTIYIEGWGYRVVEDLGVEGEWVDIFYSSHEAASAHGLQYVNVYLVN